MLPYIKLLLLAFFVKETSAQCAPYMGRYTFGSDCQFQCHCTNVGERCDQSTGSCTTGCLGGWLGPGCQFKNMAYRVLPDGSNAGSLSSATDGVVTTCITQPSLADDPYIRVQMDNEVMVTEVSILFSNYTAAKGFSVYAGANTDRNAVTLCGTDTDVTPDNNYVTVVCLQKMMARFITVQVNGPSRQLIACEIHVPAGRSIAYRKPVEAGTTQNGYEPWRAVDGRLDQLYVSLYPTTDPFITIDLEASKQVNMVEIHNRDGLLDHAIGMQLFISDTGNFSYPVWQDQSSRSTVPAMFLVSTGSQLGQYVKLTVPGISQGVDLKEVYVYGGCSSSDRCGFDCNILCQCERDIRSAKDAISGYCGGSCDRNWKGRTGYCNESVCTNGNFGHECKYPCHCDGQCDPWTGQCMDDTNCQLHYYGPLCQGYNSIGGSKFATQGSSTYYSANATVDGNVSTCAPVLSGQDASWTVPLLQTRKIGQIMVFVNESTVSYGCEVYAETDTEAYRCDTARVGNTGEYIARCRGQEATHLRIRTRGSFQICEVVVLECSPGTYGDACLNLCMCADQETCDPITGQCPSVCEAGYYGAECNRECQSGYYGSGCTMPCGHCAGGVVCDIFNGKCPGACTAGWQGDRCDIECRNGTYGQGCLSECGFCIDGEACDKETGACSSGCDAGYYTDGCTKECEAGLFSYNCNSTCGECINDEICNRVDGSCRGGCKIGFQPPTCLDKCQNNTYGLGCANLCGNCRDNTTCNSVSGVCEAGCDPGFVVTTINPMCNRACDDGNYGYNCSYACATDVCEGGNVCNKSTGACLKGCLYPGFQPPLCQTDCCDGTYGLGCRSVCGVCKDRVPCNKTTGMCPAGCESGFDGDRCEVTNELSTASIVMLSLGIVLALFGLLAVGLAYWVYQKGSPLVKLRNKYKKGDEKPVRNDSVISHVYENNMMIETEGSKLKQTNGDGRDKVTSDAHARGTIAVEDMWDYVLDMKKRSTELAKQFKEFPVGLTHPCEVAKKGANLRKNRYKDLFAYDHSRVRLDVDEGDKGTDYINASYISGYSRPHMYIAAQGPTDELVGDFWRMVWQKKCRKLVMLTRLVEHNKVKCSQYWPEEGYKQYGNITVVLKGVESFADFDIRTFELSRDGSGAVREVRQFHYESWPDRHTPEYASSVIHFWSKVRDSDSKDNVPILVHCSAGTGRTGTFLALDYLVEQANAEGYINVPQCVQNLRHQRVNMIQNQDQYVFLHEALVEALLCPSTAVPCDQFPSVYQRQLEMDPKTGKPNLFLEYEKLQHVTKFNESLSTTFYDGIAYKSARAGDNVSKNRSKTILPNDDHRPFLTSRVRDTNDYINAVFQPSYHEDKMYLQTEHPLPDTIIDFWRMIYENNVTTIVTVDRVQVGGSRSEVFWPEEKETLTFIPFQLYHVTETDHLTYIERTMKILNAEEPREKARIIKQFECKFWNGNSKVPEGGETSLLAVHDQVQKWQQITGNQPIVVHCLNGASKSGLFCAIGATIERMKEEHEVALQQTIKQMRIRRHQIIPTYEQYKFCHDVILDYLRSTETDGSDTKFFI